MGSELSSRTRYCSRCLTTFIGELDRCPNLACRSLRPASDWGTLLDSGDTFDRHYLIERRLAIGGAGVTYLGRELDSAGEEIGPKVAIKVLYAQRDEGNFLRRLSNEAQIMQELSHPGIVQLMGFVHRKGHSPYLLTRFQGGGSLLDHLRRVGAVSVQEAAGIGLQIANALAVAHERGVIHRDLKPENILLGAIPEDGDTPQVCLTDFGIAKISGGVGANLTRVGAFVGTPQYAAPEQFAGRAPTPATDIYALGAVLHFLVTLKPLIPKVDRMQVDQTLEILNEILPPRVQIADSSPEELTAFNALLAATMTRIPEDRAPMARVRELLDSVVYDRPPIIPGNTPPVVTDEEQDEITDTFQGILSKELSEETGEYSLDHEEIPATAEIPGDDDVDPEVFRKNPTPTEAPDTNLITDDAPEVREESESKATPTPIELPDTKAADSPTTDTGGTKTLVAKGCAFVAVVAFVALVGLVGLTLSGVRVFSEWLPDIFEAATPDSNEHVEEVVEPAVSLDPIKPSHKADYRAIQSALQAESQNLAACANHSTARLRIRVSVEVDGVARSVSVSALEGAQKTCAEDLLRNLTYERTGATGGQPVTWTGVVRL